LHSFRESDLAFLQIQFRFCWRTENPARRSLNSRSHLWTTTVAKQMPIKFTAVRPMGRK
jgi:hypothetical protein